MSIENEIITRISEVVRAKYPKASISSEYIKAPSSFPHISIIEQDNFTAEEYMDSGDKEKITNIMYEVSVYSNNIKDKKGECKNIVDIINRTMYSLNFIRTSLTPVPNMENATIYRMVGRYNAATDGKKIYRR